MRTLKRSFATFLSVAVLAASLPVEARVGASSGGARPAPSVSRTAPAPRPAPAPAAPSQRVTSGGMQRSDVMAQARAQSPNNPANVQRVAPQAAPTPAPAPAPVNNYATQPQQQRQGYSGGQLAGAAAAAGVGGYLLGRATAPTPAPAVAPQGGGYVQAPQGGYVQGGPGYVQNGEYGAPSYQAAPTYQAPAPVVVQPGSSGMGFFGMLIILALLGGFAYFMYRRFAEQTAGSSSSYGSSAARSSNAFSQGTSTSAAETELLNRAPKLFRDVQNANNAGDKVALERLVDESFLPQLVADIDNRAEPSHTSVMKLDVVGDRVLGFTREGYRYVGSVHFNALISEGGAPAETVEEVWHFVRNVDGGEWKLAGIEQV